MFVLLHGELKGMVIVGKSKDAAETLLSDIQAELSSNGRWIADFGEQIAFGNWSDADFTIKSGCRFVSFGRGQSPRGVRSKHLRPNYCVIDDIDDDKMARNEKLVDECVDWIMSALFGAFDIKETRFVMVGNRITKRSVLACIVGDVEPGDPKRKDMYHSKVAALDVNGEPSWKEKFTKQELQKRFDIMGYRLSQREYFHNPITEGKVFKADWMAWGKPLALKKYDYLVLYVDPSFKNTNTSDYKAAWLIGKIGTKLHKLRAFCRKCSVTELVTWLYDRYDEFKSADVICEFWIEGNFIQSILMDDFEVEGDKRGYQLPIRADMRNKPNKGARIESLAALYERGFMMLNENLKSDKDYKVAQDQLVLFEQGGSTHDDAPDAEEGAVFILQQRTRSSKSKRTLGERRPRSW